MPNRVRRSLKQEVMVLLEKHIALTHAPASHKISTRIGHLLPECDAGHKINVLLLLRNEQNSILIISVPHIFDGTAGRHSKAFVPPRYLIFRKVRSIRSHVAHGCWCRLVATDKIHD